MKKKVDKLVAYKKFSKALEVILEIIKEFAPPAQAIPKELLHDPNLNELDCRLTAALCHLHMKNPKEAMAQLTIVFRDLKDSGKVLVSFHKPKDLHREVTRCEKFILV